MKKKTNIRTMIRKIVREEVAMAIQEVITELRQPQQPTKPKHVEKQKYSKNTVLNDVLNETANGEDWKTMGGSQFTTERINELVGSNYASMMKDDSDTPTPTPPVNTSDPMSQFLNKNYSEVLKKAEQKDKQKHSG